MNKPIIFTYPTIRETYIVYYFCYMKNLHTMLNNNLQITYEWLDLKNYKFINIWHKRCFRDFDRKDNGYLWTAQKDVTKLGRDIIKRGGYWPFACRDMDQDNKKEIIFGKHRLFSLLTLQNQEPDKDIIHKEFLFIKIPPMKQRRKIVYNKKITMYHFFENGQTAKITTNKNHLIEDAWSSNADTLSATFHKWDLLNASIEPNPILNNKDLFQQFINQPFDKNNIAYQLLVQKLKEFPIDKPNGYLADQDYQYHFYQFKNL